MRYMGGKAKLAKDIIPIITKDLPEDGTFVDLFAGGMNIVDKVDCKDKIANDFNKYIIALWREIQSKGTNFLPENVTEDDYRYLRGIYTNNACAIYSNIQALIGFVSTACSYGGGFWNGYAKFNPNKNEDHTKEACNGIRKQVEKFKYLDSTRFTNYSYHEWLPYSKKNKILHPNHTLPPADKCIIYCDPPYANTKHYETDFNNNSFWAWVKTMAKTHKYKIYVSEYTAPDFMERVWEKEIKCGMGTTYKGKPQMVKVEKLFVVR